MPSNAEQFPDHILQAADDLRRGCVGVAPESGLEEMLLLAEREKRPLRVKLGLDPTAPDIHLGFAVVLRKLRQFQDLGHQVVIIIGDYTALIGDPSGRSVTRPMLTEEETKANGATYVEQLGRILDSAKTEVRFNSEWLGGLTFAELVRLAARMTVAQVMERDDFATRFAAHQPISLHELLYPLAQAYDSVAIDSDVEMGGQDQTFNILAGRALQRELGRPQQIGFFMPLVVGLDGTKKMSKSLGNYVGIAESPIEMFSKLMSIPDTLLESYFVSCTLTSIQRIERLMAGMLDGTVNPRDAKRELARSVVAMYHSDSAAEAADAEWMHVHSEGGVPDEMPEAVLPPDAVRNGKVWICRLLVAVGLAGGTGDARRLVEQGAVVLNGLRVGDAAAELAPADLNGAVLQVGPKRFTRIKAN